MKYDAEARTAATQHGLDPELVIALCLTESGGDPWAWNPEPRYRYFWNARTSQPFRAVTRLELESKFPPSDFKGVAGDHDQEWWGQQASWGLMQIMGAVARENGFHNPYLPQLCDPVANLEIGCRHLKSLMRWSNNRISPALAAYNGGKSGNGPTGPLRNQAYVNKVVARMIA